MFIDREVELGVLNQALNSNSFQFIVIYGRRRVGKTALIREAIQSKENALYFQATEQDEKINIQNFKQQVSQTLEDNLILGLQDDWGVLLTYLIDKIEILAIDEFPYLAASNPAIKSIFQKFIDAHENRSFKLILCGSSIGMMEDQILGAKSPLYGRRTMQIKLKPLDFIHLKSFFPNYSWQQLIAVFGSVGGIPYYLLQFKPEKTFWENVASNMLSPFSVLFDEGSFLLKEEFSQISTYSSILFQIANGKTKVNKIKSNLSIKGEIAPYLHSLERIDLIERRVPFGEDKSKSRRGRYYLKDHYLQFWYKFVYSQRDMINFENTELMIARIKEKYNSYLGLIYEVVVKQLLQKMIISRRIVLPFYPISLSNWWYKDREIDLVGQTDENYLFVEIKWSKISKIEVKREIFRLKEKVKKTHFSGNFYYLLVVKSFSDKTKDHGGGDFKILTLNDLV